MNETLEEYHARKLEQIEQRRKAREGQSGSPVRRSDGFPAQKPVPPPPPCTGDLSQPGSLVKSVLASLGIKPKPGCGCERFCRKMNAWGWVGCVKHRREIIQWFGAKAKQSSIDISPAGLRRIVLNAIFRRHSISK